MPKRHRLIFEGEASPCLQPRLSLNSLKSVNPITHFSNLFSPMDSNTVIWLIAI